MYLLFAELPHRQDVLADQWVQERRRLEVRQLSNRKLSWPRLRGQEPGQRRRVTVTITNSWRWKHDHLYRGNNDTTELILNYFRYYCSKAFRLIMRTLDTTVVDRTIGKELQNFICTWRKETEYTVMTKVRCRFEPLTDPKLQINQIKWVVMGGVVPGGNPGSEARWTRGGSRKRVSPVRRGLGARVRIGSSRGGVERGCSGLWHTGINSK